jgi:hypothetical protein
MARKCNRCGKEFSTTELPLAPQIVVIEIDEIDEKDYPLDLCPDCLRQIDIFINGYHCGQEGWNPFGVYCGECSRSTCRNCKHKGDRE